MSESKPSSEVERLAANGQKTAAIKLYRLETGVGLAVAKGIVDALQQGNSPAAMHKSSRSDSRAISRRTGAFLAATILGLVAVVITGTAIYRSHQSTSWIETSGRIVSSELNTEKFKQANTVDVEYEYVVEETVHRGTRISFGKIWGSWLVQETLNRYREGSEVVVYHDPVHPKQSVLEKQISLPYRIIFFISMLSLVWGIVSWAKAAKAERVGRPK